MKYCKLIYFMLFLTSSCLLFLTCSPTETEKQKLELSIEDVSCTETWISVKGETGSEIILNRDDKEVKRFKLATSPQTVYDDSLQPNKTYSYRVSRIENQETSRQITASTLDTTSHNFNWQTWTFGGDAGSCTLYDVSIIDENNIWAVGEINIADTSENGYTSYNAVHWNGSEWELKRISVMYNGNIITPPLYGIYTFSSKDIWLSSGVPIKGDGNTWIQYHLFDMGILDKNDGYLTKIWGTSSSDLYYVGSLGTIVHYKNGQWNKIESETDLTINDIYGAYNKQTGQYEILAPASNVLESLDRDLLKISGNSVSHLSTSPILSTLSSVWFKPNIKYYLAGDGIYLKNMLDEPQWKNKPLDVTTYYSYRIRGSNINDVAAAGGVGEVIHFNGISWHSYFEHTKLPSGNYYGLDFKDNIIIAVGQDNPKAVITLGRR